MKNLILHGEFSEVDSLNITESFFAAKEAVDSLFILTNALYQDGDKDSIIEKWNQNEHFSRWLSNPSKLKSVRRKINRIHSKFQKQVHLVVIRKDRGRCHGWISAWTLPYGKVKIRLCDDFLKYRTHLQEKTIIHEMGHEAGMLYHHRIHGCWAAERAAGSAHNKVKRSPENYAWLAASLLGLECKHPQD